MYVYATAHHRDTLPEPACRLVQTSAMTNPPVGSLFRRAAIRGNATEAILGQNQVRNAGMKFVLGETNSIAQSGAWNRASEQCRSPAIC